MDPRREQRALEAGAHIVVGTPGRLCDHLRRGRLDVSRAESRRARRGRRDARSRLPRGLEFILETTPETRRTLLFSATLPRTSSRWPRRYQHDALRIDVAGRDGGHADIEYRAVRIAPSDVEHAVVNTAALRRVARPRSCSAPPASGVTPSARPRCWSAASRSSRCPASSPRTNAPTRCKRCATAAPASASPPTSPRAASTCPISAWSSTPTCRTIPK